MGSQRSSTRRKSTDTTTQTTLRRWIPEGALQGEKVLQQRGAQEPSQEGATKVQKDKERVKGDNSMMMKTSPQQSRVKTTKTKLNLNCVFFMIQASVFQPCLISARLSSNQCRIIVKVPLCKNI